MRLPDFRRLDSGFRARFVHGLHPIQKGRSDAPPDRRQRSMSAGVDNRELRLYWAACLASLPAAELGLHLDDFLASAGYLGFLPPVLCP